MERKQNSRHMIQESEAQEFIRNYCTFPEDKNHGYLLMGIARRKHNENISNSEEIIIRRIITESDDIGRNYREMKALMASHQGLTFRLYMTINPRDLQTAYFNLLDDMNTWTRKLIEGDDGIKNKFDRISSEWKSAAHSPDASDGSRFQFDLDEISRDELETFISELEEHTDIILTRETPNGYHIISEPFNHTEFEPSIEYDEMDTDGQLFIEEIKT